MMKTTRENVTAKIDWLQIIFHNCYLDELLNDLLRIDKSCLMVESAMVKHKDYDICYSYGSLKIYSFEFLIDEETELYLSFSGDACTLFERLLCSLQDTWENFFCKLIKQFENRFKIKRLDVALDDRNEIPYFKVEQLIKLCKKKQYESRRRKFHVTESNIQGTKTSKTLYIGKRTSDIMFRIYDKDYETAKKEKKAIQEIGSWKRLEIELKKEVADAFIRLLAEKEKTLEELTKGLIKQELTFYLDEHHKCIPRFWTRYLGNVAPIDIKRKYSIRGLSDTEHWFLFGGGLATLKALKFLEEKEALGSLKQITMELSTVELSRPLAKKMIDHLVDIGRQELIQEVYSMTKKENLKKDKIIQSQAPL